MSDTRDTDLGSRPASRPASRPDTGRDTGCDTGTDTGTETDTETARDSRDHLAEAARRSQARARLALEDPEPSLGSRLGQIGILGWAIVTPILLGVVLGRLADRQFGTAITFTAAGIFLGAVIGLHAAWKWMHRQ